MEWTKLWLGSWDHQLAITRSVVMNTPLQAGKTRARGKTGGAVSFNHDGSLHGVATFFSFADTVTSDSAHRSSFVPSISGIYHHYHSTSRVSCVGRSAITRRYNPDPHVPNTCNKSEQQSLSAGDPFTFFPLLQIEAHLVARASKDSQFNLQHHYNIAIGESDSRVCKLSRSTRSYSGCKTQINSAGVLDWEDRAPKSQG